MNGKGNKSFVVIAILLLVVGISIGYAALSATLNITGNTTIGKATWDVHFENLNETAGSVTAVTPAAIDAGKTNITYAVTLTQPGDFYEFTVDFKNGGTIPAKVAATPTLAGLSEDQKAYINYTATYSDGTPVQANDALDAAATKTIKVRVEYRSDITSDVLPAEGTSAELTFAMNFIQE